MNKKIPSVRMAYPGGRPIQLRYNDPESGKEVRISTKTRDVSVAVEQKKDLEAKLRLGQDAKPRKRTSGSPGMLWEEFRERYSTYHLSGLKSAVDAEGKLDIAERIAKPRTLADIASSETLHELQSKMLNGEGSTRNRARSPHTVKSNMAVLMAALKWAEYMGWLHSVPRLKRIKTTKLRHMKGRPITALEFKAMITVTPTVVGDKAAPSWRYLLRGLRESGLRLSEILHVHWSDRRYIVPDWTGELPTLAIPADMQKNATEESIPLLPGFENLLLQTPEDNRCGWVFSPLTLNSRLGRVSSGERLSEEWAGKVISRIGEKAEVVVSPAVGDKPPKFASAHDLRRSCADGLVAAGVPEREIAAVMRHASVETTRRHYTPGNVQRSAGIIREKLKTPERT